jgi:hypothetical protein
MLSRRAFGSLVGAAACVGAAAESSVSAPTLDLDAIPLAAHEAAMRLVLRGKQDEKRASIRMRVSPEA